MTTVVPVELAERSYEVLVGDGVRHELARVIERSVPSARRAVVVTQERIGVEVDPGVPFEVVTVPDGESAKSLGHLEELCRRFARSGLSRSDVVVAVGGGVVTDLAGFAAASFHRGTAYVNVATSLLAQVDAAIGGKTGVNLPEGKNLVGAFWQPSAVLCDTGTLDSLPPREWASGRGEVAKYALLGIDTDLGGPPTAHLATEEQVARCAAVKAAVVASDEREGDRRMLLNYGHTLAHALEASAFDDDAADLRHGEAVAVGLVFVALLARRLGRIDDTRVAHHREVVGTYDLSTDLPPGRDPEQLLEFMGRDKKAQGDLTFVLDGPDGVEVVHGIGRADVVATLAEMESLGRGAAS
jgi:5-deoxy-5-amino-3-dehydroquinate synthase